MNVRQIMNLNQKRAKAFAIILSFLLLCTTINTGFAANPYGATIKNNSIISTQNALKKYKQKSVYYITPSSTPLKSSGYTNYHTYNKYTRNYYTILSYMAQFQKKGGGTLVLKKGTYSITNTVFIPSNVTIIMESGVTLKKGTKTYVSDMPAATSMFQLLQPSYCDKSGVVGKHNGMKNIHIVGVGNVTVDLCYFQKSIAIIMGHNKNVTVSGISFENLNTGHFIEMDACYNVTVSDCNFANVKIGSDYVKEAINIDTPDKETLGFSSDWSTFDKTPNEKVTITNCTFKKLGRAIGTHKYSAKGSTQMMHTDIKITNNIISDMYNDAPIRAMNWKNPNISYNTINNVYFKVSGVEKSDTRAILLSGTKNATVTRNQISNVGRAIQFIAWKNSGPGASYPEISDSLSQQNKVALSKNYASKLTLGEYFTRITYTYNQYSNAEKISLIKK